MSLFGKIIKKFSNTKSQELNVYAPMDGKVLDQKEIPDAGFSEGYMGVGLGIEPTDGKVLAFLDGVLEVLFRTKHAYFIKDPESGISVMLHIGINTVEIPEDKKAFETNKSEKDNLKVGEHLCTANLSVIESEGKSIISALLVQNENMDSREVIFHKKPGEMCKAGELLMTIK